MNLGNLIAVRMPYRVAKSTKKRIHNFCKKAEKYDFWGFKSKMGVSREKVRLVGQFEILAQDNFFPSKVRLVGQFYLRNCPTGRTQV